MLPNPALVSSRPSHHEEQADRHEQVNSLHKCDRARSVCRRAISCKSPDARAAVRLTRRKGNLRQLVVVFSRARVRGALEVKERRNGEGDEEDRKLVRIDLMRGVAGV